MAIAIVQQAHASNSGATNLVISFANNVAAGNAVIVIGTRSYRGNYGNSISGVSGVGGTFTADRKEATNGFRNCEFWSALNVSGGSKDVTIAQGAYGNKEGWALEVSGLVTSGTRLDGANGEHLNSSSGSTFSTGTITPAAGVEILLLTGMFSLTAPTAGPTSGYTTLTGAVYGNAGYQIISSPSGSYNATWTGMGNYSHHACILAAYQAPAGGGPAFTPRGLWFTR